MPLPTRAPRDRFPYPQDPRSVPCSAGLEPGDYVYVQEADGVVWVLPNGPHQHPKVLGGARPAAAAGELVLGDGGSVAEVNNLSGTFRCGPETLDAVVEALRACGLDVPEDAVRRYAKHLL